MRLRDQPILTACLLSCLGHLLFVVLTPEQTPRVQRSQLHDLEVSFDVASPAPAAPTREEAAPMIAASSHVPGKRQRPNAVHRAAPEPVQPTAPVAPAETPTAPSAPVEPHSVGTRDLSPRAAADTLRAEIEKQLAGGSCAVARDSDASCESDASERVVNTVPGSAARRPASDAEFPLKRTAAGGYVYQSRGLDARFDARIEPNGDVHFDDKVRDLNGLVSGMVGEQAYTALKRKFLAETAALRERMADEARGKDQRRGLIDLAHHLQHILADARRTPLQKRVAVFALWDDCADDNLGSEAQHTIEAFIRDRMPEEGGLGYTHDELAQLNRRRVSKRAFQPYARPDAGTRPG